MTTNTEGKYRKLKLAVLLEYFGNRLGNSREHQSKYIALVRQDLQQLGIPHPKGNKVLFPTLNSVQFYWLSQEGSTLHRKLLEKIRQNGPTREMLTSLSLSEVTLHELFDDRQDSQPDLSNFTSNSGAFSAGTHQPNHQHQGNSRSSNSYHPQTNATNGPWQAQPGKMKLEQQSPPASLFNQAPAPFPPRPSSSISTYQRRSPPPHNWPPSNPDHRPDHLMSPSEQHPPAYHPLHLSDRDRDSPWSADAFPPHHPTHAPPDRRYSHGHPPPHESYDASHPYPNSEYRPTGYSEFQLAPALQSRLTDPHPDPRPGSVSSNHSHGRNVWPLEPDRAPPPHTSPAYGSYLPEVVPDFTHSSSRAHTPPYPHAYGPAHGLPPPSFYAPALISQPGDGVYERPVDSSCARGQFRAVIDWPHRPLGPTGPGDSAPRGPRGGESSGPPVGPRGGENGPPLGSRANSAHNTYGPDRSRKRSFPEDNHTNPSLPFSSNERYREVDQNAGASGWGAQSRAGPVSGHKPTRRGQGRKRQRVEKDAASSQPQQQPNGAGPKLNGPPASMAHPLPPNPLESVKSIPPSVPMRTWGSGEAKLGFGKDSGVHAETDGSGAILHAPSLQDAGPSTIASASRSQMHVLPFKQDPQAALLPRDQSPKPERESSYDHDSPSVPMFGVGAYTPAPDSGPAYQASAPEAELGKKLSSSTEPDLLPENTLDSRSDSLPSAVNARLAVVTSAATPGHAPKRDASATHASLPDRPQSSVDVLAPLEQKIKSEEPPSPVIALTATSIEGLDVDSTSSRPILDTPGNDSGSLASSRAVSAAPAPAPAAAAAIDFMILESPPTFKLSPASWPPASAPQSECERNSPSSPAPLTTPLTDAHTPRRAPAQPPESPSTTTDDRTLAAAAKDSAEVQIPPPENEAATIEVEVDTDMEQEPEAEAQTQGPPRLRMHRSMAATPAASSSSLSSQSAGWPAGSPSRAPGISNGVVDTGIDPSVVASLRAELAAALAKSDEADKDLVSIKEELAAERKRREASEKMAVDARKRVGEVNGYLQDERKKCKEVEWRLEEEQKKRVELEGRVEDSQKRSVDAENARTVAEARALEAVSIKAEAESRKDEAERSQARAEKLLADVRRECTAPFMVPGLYDAYVTLWGLRETQQGKSEGGGEVM